MSIRGYALHQTGKLWLTFNTLEELEAELRYRGLPMGLSVFKDKPDKGEEYCKNKYQNWSALAYFE